MNIRYRKIKEHELIAELFQQFKRHEVVNQCLKQQGDIWSVQDASYTEDWSEKDKVFLLECLKSTIRSGGRVLGAFYKGQLAGFASVEGKRFGTEHQYVELTSLHVSEQYRKNGIGKKLFLRACRQAQWLGARKLYIGSSISFGTQQFYQSLGCIDALEEKEGSRGSIDERKLEFLLTGTKAYQGIFLFLGTVAGAVYGNVVLGMTIPGAMVGFLSAFLLGRLYQGQEKKSKERNVR